MIYFPETYDRMQLLINNDVEFQVENNWIRVSDEDAARLSSISDNSRDDSQFLIGLKEC